MKLAVFALAAIAPSCASIINGNHDTITVNSLEKGTTIYVDNVARGTDTATVEVKRGKPHMLRVEKEGYQTITAETGESFDATSLLGILIDFGIITIPIDLVSGAAWKTEPRMYTLTPMRPGSTPPPTAEEKPTPSVSRVE